MALGARYRDKVEDALLSELSAVGYTRYRKEWVDWPLSKDFHAWVGLNNGVYRDHVQFEPFVGIHSPPLMRLASEVDGRRYSRSTATYAIHMGEIAPHEKLFRFDEATDIEAEAKRLARLYRTIGMDYSRSLASYEVLLPLFRENIKFLGGYPDRYAVCLHLLGRDEEAIAFVKECTQKEPDYMSRFAEGFLRYLEEHRRASMH